MKTFVFIHSIYFILILFPLWVYSYLIKGYCFFTKYIFFLMSFNFFETQRKTRKHRSIELYCFSANIISLIERERLQQSTITNGNIRESGSCNSLSQQRWNDITMVKYNKTTLKNEEWTTTIHQME